MRPPSKYVWWGGGRGHFSKGVRGHGISEGRGVCVFDGICEGRGVCGGQL